MNLWVMLNKEWSENVRTYRLLLVPLLFVLLGGMTVVLTKMLPELIASSGDIPAGTVIQIPEPKAMDAVASFTPQFDQLGVLALILLFMSTLAGERASGVMTTILVKPVSKWSYVGSKLLMAFFMVTVSYLLSAVCSWYYINQIFTEYVYFKPFLLGNLVYLPKLLVFAAIILFFSSISKSPIVAGGLSLVSVIGLSAASAIPWVQEHLPFGLGKQALALMQEQSPEIWQPLLSAGVIILALYVSACYLVARRES